MRIMSIRRWFLVFIIGFTFYPLFSIQGKSASSLDNPYVETYPFKSVIIHYRTKFIEESPHKKVNTYTLDTVMYMEGNKISKLQEGKMPAQTEKGFKEVKNIDITTPEYIYAIDLLKKEGVKVDNPKKYTISAYNSLSPEEKKEFHDRMKRIKRVSFDLPLRLGEKVGTDKILGRECDVYEDVVVMDESPDQAQIPGDNKSKIKSWLWKGTIIPLKGTQESIQTSSVYWFEKVATKIEENAEIPKDKFEVPSDVKITYDDYSSEYSKEVALRRFEYYKTGKWSNIKMKLKPEKQSGIKTESKQQEVKSSANK